MATTFPPDAETIVIYYKHNGGWFKQEFDFLESAMLFEQALNDRYDSPTIGRFRNTGGVLTPYGEY